MQANNLKKKEDLTRKISKRSHQANEQYLTRQENQQNAATPQRLLPSLTHLRELLGHEVLWADQITMIAQQLKILNE